MLVSALAWFAIAIVMLRLHDVIRGLAKTINDFSSGGPLNSNVRLITSRAVQSLNSAIASKGGKAAPMLVARTITALVRPDAVRRLQGTHVLWVDDIPANNLYERRAMEVLGIEVSTSPDTDDALRQLAQGNVDLIISDMGRPSGKWAGLALLDVVKKHFPSMPFVIYTASNDRQHKAEAKQRGASHATNDARDLMVVAVKLLNAR